MEGSKWPCGEKTDCKGSMCIFNCVGKLGTCFKNCSFIDYKASTISGIYRL